MLTITADESLPCCPWCDGMAAYFTDQCIWVQCTVCGSRTPGVREPDFEDDAGDVWRQLCRLFIQSPRLRAALGRFANPDHWGYEFDDCSEQADPFWTGLIDPVELADAALKGTPHHLLDRDEIE